jgi:uncharacterized protein YxeA
MNKTLIVILIIVLVAGVVGATIFLLNQEIQEEFLIGEEAIEKVAEKEINGDKKGKEESLPAYSSSNLEDLIISEEFIDKVRNKIIIYCDKAKVNIVRYEEEYQGFPWIKDDNEVELIKGYYFYSQVHDDELIKENCRKNILSFLEESLIVNVKNSSKYIFAFELDNIKCTIFPYGSLNLYCGDISKGITPKEYRGIYKAINPTLNPDIFVSVGEIVDNFAIAGTISYAVLLKKEEDGWKNLFETQDGFECEIVLKHKVPPSLIGNSCMFYKTTREVWRYDEELKKWKKWYHIDSPWDKQ